ncbi:hypothetical protein [Anaerosacchariphilus polymeriproducens]|uniref:Glycosyltransferase family 2 protein n=1 Tax=Anaerosacchariphilus polymeriproducens TaxID=1812858 RepID=A0A371AV73_9FIRM|nr:hypothetical protein [Anaerosacchariphilus polymeriproducens]RDU23475.1 hypothetical protein DWV06_09255 [Anaerosacchariphilus polymeriproducens]
MQESKIKVGIGFATGRKSFRKVLNAYIYSWNEMKVKSNLEGKVSLNLFVAYDINYSNAQSTDFTNLSQEMVDTFDEIEFLGAKNIQKKFTQLIDNQIMTEKEIKQIFRSGYAGKRNAIVYAALENKMDYLLFLDDDEYPVAVTNNHGICVWGGQNVIPNHIKNIENADITNGYHCGYISPIPQISFNETLSEKDFAKFIEAISNDIISWDSIREKMKNGGTTYADTSILTSKEPQIVEEKNHCKFISGSNLCINLKRPERLFPFYNPPGARGEDTFLSTLLSDRIVLRVPCYTFHDGFSIYRHLLDGVLPLQLLPITAQSKNTVTRFYNACIGWIRYKPLLVYITNQNEYDEIIAKMQTTLEEVLPKICEYFENDKFMNILPELNKYNKNIKNHYHNFNETQNSWKKLLENI